MTTGKGQRDLWAELMTAEHSSPTRNMTIVPVQEGEDIFFMEKSCNSFILLFCKSIPFYFLLIKNIHPIFFPPWNVSIYYGPAGVV